MTYKDIHIGYCDGHGLNLRVDPSGARRWVQRLVIRGRPRMLGLGGYPLVSLAEARDVAFAHRKQARAGGDPLTEKRHAQHVPTVEEAAAAVLEQQRSGWRHARYERDWPRSLRAYAFPRIGAVPVSDVTTADVLAILTPIWHDKPETARRVRQRIGAVMKWAVAMGYRPDNPAGDVLGQVLGRQRAVVQHMRALPHGAVADALATVRTSRALVTTKDAFELLVLTAARSGEVRLATWDEMDLDAGVWTIPAARIEGRPRVGVWLMPDNRSAGELEDFILRLMPAGDAIWPRARRYIDDIPAADRKFATGKTLRAEIHAWLATRAAPRKMGAAIGAGDLNITDPLASQFVGWLRQPKRGSPKRWKARAQSLRVVGPESVPWSASSSASRPMSVGV